MSQLVSRPAGAIVADAEQKPLLTAILITRNKESYIRECLCGLMEQTIANRMEVIVVDQGSEQSEWFVIADLQRRYQNLIALRTAASGGPCTGLNLAVKLAQGRYLTVIEATDRLRNDAYELLAGTLNADPDAMLAYGDTCFTAIPHESFANHTSYGKMIWPDYTSQQLLQLSLIAPHLMWRRELGETIGGFDERYQSQGMRDFLLRTVERFRIVHVEEFVGLRLVASGAPLNQDSVERELCVLKQNHQTVAQQPASAAPVAAAPPFSQTVAAAQPVATSYDTASPATGATPPPAAASAEESYARIEKLVAGGADREAAAELERHLERYPRHAVAHNDLAALSYRFGDTDRALAHYRKAVQFGPEEPLFQKNLADLCFVAGQVDEAINIYLKLHERSPRDTETLLNLGIICESVGQPDEAESFYQRALEVEPANQAVRQRVTDLRLRMTAPEEASAEELYQEAQGMVARGDFGAASVKLEEILERFPDFPLAHNDLAVIRYQDGAKDAARFHYERAAALAPENSTFRKNLADYYFVEGYDVDGAISIYLDLLQRDPGNVETLMSLGKICAILGRPQEAEAFYGKVTQLEPYNQDARECLNTLRFCANG